MKNDQEAQKYYMKALELNNNKNIILKLGKLYIRQGQSDATQQLFAEYA